MEISGESIKPAGHRVVVLVDKVEEKTKSGIYLAGTTVDKNQMSAVVGTVISVGKDCWKEFGDGSPWCEVGDRVIIAKYGGLFLKDIIDDLEDDYRIVNDEDILAVIQKD